MSARPPPIAPTISPRATSANICAGIRRKSMLRFITCGSVDDGKSTLIGRLLYDSKLIFEDQLAALEADSKRVGTQGQEIDFALLVDGLAAEREQGITIDVAYRFFATEKRKFIVADTPGHEQYTRNMVTGGIERRSRRDPDRCAPRRAHADAPPQLSRQPARHPRHRAGGEQDGSGRLFARTLRRDRRRLSRVRGEHRHRNISPPFRYPGCAATTSSRAARTCRGSTGPALLPHLETRARSMPIAWRRKPFRMPVQWVNRPNLDFRGFAGTDRLRHDQNRAMRSACCPPAARRRSNPSSPSTANSRRHARGRR